MLYCFHKPTNNKRNVNHSTLPYCLVQWQAVYSGYTRRWLIDSGCVCSATDKNKGWVIFSTNFQIKVGPITFILKSNQTLSSLWAQSFWSIYTVRFMFAFTRAFTYKHTLPDQNERKSTFDPFLFNFLCTRLVVFRFWKSCWCL